MQETSARSRHSQQERIPAPGSIISRDSHQSPKHNRDEWDVQRDEHVGTAGKVEQFPFAPIGRIDFVANQQVRIDQVAEPRYAKCIHRQSL